TAGHGWAGGCRGGPRGSAEMLAESRDARRLNVDGGRGGNGGGRGAARRRAGGRAPRLGRTPPAPLGLVDRARRGHRRGGRHPAHPRSSRGHYTRKELNASESLRGDFQSVHVTVFPPGYEIHRLKIDERVDPDWKHPLFYAERVKAGLDLRSLVHGRLVAHDRLDDPK